MRTPHGGPQRPRRQAQERADMQSSLRLLTLLVIHGWQGQFTAWLLLLVFEQTENTLTHTVQIKFNKRRWNFVIPAGKLGGHRGRMEDDTQKKKKIKNKATGNFYKLLLGSWALWATDAGCFLLTVYAIWENANLLKNGQLLISFRVLIDIKQCNAANLVVLMLWLILFLYEEKSCWNGCKDKNRLWMRWDQ